MRELTDAPEVEVKLDYDTPDHVRTVLAATHATLPDGFRIVELPQRVVVDYYFDTTGFALARTGAALRLRRRRAKAGFNANFKTPDETPGHDYVVRREVRSRLSVGEALALGDSGSRATNLAFEHLGEKADLVPTVAVTISRRQYAAQPPDAPSSRDHLLVVLFDEVSAADVRDVDLAMLLDEGALPWSPDRATYAFAEVEVERTGTGVYQTREEWALELFEQLIPVLKEAGGTITSASKYERALRGIEPAAFG